MYYNLPRIRPTLALYDSRSSDELVSNDFAFLVQENIKTFLRKLPTPLLMLTVLAASTVFVVELSKVIFLSFLPITLLLGTVFSTLLFGQFFLIIAASLAFLFAPFVLSISSAFSLASLSLIALCSLVVSLAAQVLLNPAGKKQGKGPASSGKALLTEVVMEEEDQVSANIDRELLELRQFDRRLREIDDR